MHFTHKNIALILIAILIVGGAFALAEFRNSQTKDIVYSAPIEAVVNQLPPDLQDMDSDNDGLKDWEEVLLGTNPHKADSDGDGTEDGKEASSGRNPLVKGPGDTAGKTPEKTPLTPVDRIARDFFARYMELNQAGLAKDAVSQSDLVEEITKYGVVLNKPKVYTLDDIIITEDTSKEAVRKYGNDAGGVFVKYNNPRFRNELVIMKESLDNQEFEILKELDPIILMYRNILNGLLKTPVPISVADIHLNLVNSIGILLFSSESIRKMDNDLLSAVQGSAVWMSGSNGLNKGFNDLKRSFRADDIVYAYGEAGNFFVPNE